jgi:thiosulfate dehydrogenase
VQSNSGKLKGMMRAAIGLFLSLGIFWATAHAQAQRKDLLAQGQYIFALAGGCACHTKPKGISNAGARRFPIPFGTVYSTNITQDDATGLGKWTDQEIHNAL